MTITGIDDQIKDGDKSFAIVTFPAISEDPDYKDVDPVDIIVFNKDNDTGSISCAGCESLVVTEEGGTDTFSIKLTSKPIDKVSFTITSDDPTEGIIEPEFAVIEPGEWETAKKFTVTGIDDNEADGDQKFKIITDDIISGDDYYNGMAIPDYSVTNKDYEPNMTPPDSSYDFFGIESDTTSVKYIDIENTGNDTLSLRNIQITGNIFSLDSSSMEIPEDSSGSYIGSIKIILSPGDSIGTFSGELTFSHNDPDQEKLSVMKVIAHVIEADYVGPDINISVVESIQENTALEISANITDANGVTDDATLFYRKGGETAYKHIVMQKDTSDTSTNFRSEIPAEGITWKGLNFYIRAEDERENVRNSDTLSVQISFKAGQLSTKIEDSFFKNGFPENLWRMISIPVDIDENRVEEVFMEELGKLKIKNWTIWEYTGDAKNGGFIEPVSLSPGKSYWLIQHVNPAAEFELGSGSSKDQSGFLFNLYPGWNMIGNPYPFTTTFDLNDTLFSGPHTYGKGIEGWSVETELEPWGGYAVFNRTDFSETVTLKPAESSMSLSRSIEAPLDGWELNLSAYGEIYGDRHNTIGRLSGSLEQYDFRDNPEPPYLGGYVSLVMPRDDWSDNISHFSSDIRSLNEENGVWDVELRVKEETGTVSLSLVMEGIFPVEQDIVLLDMLTREIHNLSETSSLAFHQSWDKLPVYPFKIIAGTPEYVIAKTEEILSLLPDNFALHQNYPNPFNPTTTIKFDIPEPTYISLKIYNLMGQEVRSLNNKWLPTGSHRLIWNGKDQQGIPVSTGVYIYRLQSQTFQQTRKMLLLK